MNFSPNYYLHTNTRVTNTNHVRGKMIVEGTGKLNVMPDQAVITIGVMTEDKNVEAAQQENSELANKVIASLHTNGILARDIQTVSYTIQPVYEYSDGKSVLIGYQIQHMLEVTVRDFEKVGIIYASAVSSGANIAESLRFEVSNNELYYQQALQLAMKNATEKAMKLGQQIGVTTHNVPIKVTETPKSISPREYAFSLAAESSTQQPPPIQRRSIEIIATISAVFQY
ncbi:SIMPL domain-containing protein [Metabacillus sediminilitoris]|uniref:DUF541 domain-containing protein n=1 Tax=Metabacillus sediminilitoris TaxID=2567941 RepID=A0A4S4BYV2_9BACI|nr:SIMPL domain-containing protein [Metabacillus sediminilitoris]QGQ46081.1 DUF541 domain-containing protein [Metabacillus sediminilitoris]THF79765.1 DUF541 domain-containing protein [Metabacillus sediminilitoris]